MVLVTQPADGLWTSMPRSNNARQGRALMQSLFANFDATAMNGVRSGVVPTTGLTGCNDLLPFPNGGLSIGVTPGTGVAHKAGQGPMLGWLLSSKAVTLTDAPASNPRNDIIFMRMYDLAAGDVSPDGQPCRIEVCTGTPNAAPTDPITPNAIGVYTAIPAQAGLGTGGVGIPICRAQVSTGGAVTLTDLRRGASLVGGPIFLLPGETGAAATRSGELAWNPITGLLSVSDTAGARQSIPFGNSVPRGSIGAPVTLLSGTGLTTTDTIQGEKFTGNVVTGRRYQLFHSRNEANAGVANNRFNRYRVAAGATVTVGATQIDETFVNGLTGGYNTYQFVVEWVATFTGQATFGVSTSVNTSTGLIDNTRARVIRVVDIGI